MGSQGEVEKLEKVSAKFLLVLPVACLLHLSAVWPVAAIADVTPVTSATARSIEDAELRIGAQDLLLVEVFQADDYKIEARVSNLGQISLPLIGKLQAAGKTVSELEKELASRLGKDYFQDPQVMVTVKEFTSQRITIEGNVNKPGIYSLQGQTTLLQALAMAEGVNDLADYSNVQVYRKNGGANSPLNFDLEDIRSGKLADPPVLSEDTIIVHRSGAKSFVKSVTDTLRGFVTFTTYR